jgi:LuxR family transcriptional regulator, maltose regulon positive regulatory protein
MYNSGRMQIAQVVYTKITPPRSITRLLHRPRVLEALLEAQHYRLTLVQAGAGYGKSTALAELAQSPIPVIWYSIAEEDYDPLVFLLHLCYAIRQTLPDLPDLPITLLEGWDGTRGPLPAQSLIDQIINPLSQGLPTPTLIVLDDFNLPESSNLAQEIVLLVDRLAGLAPSNLHLMLSSRTPIKLPNLSRWKSKGEVLLIDQPILAFTPLEITALYVSQYQYELTQEEGDMLWSATEGWAIALQLIWQSLRSRTSASIEDALTQQAHSLESLFEVLAQEVFGGQPEDVQDFMLITSVLREMTPEACDALRGVNDSRAMLAYLRRQELFVVETGGNTLRYHHIFHNFLRQQVSTEQKRIWHAAVATFFMEQHQPEVVLYHLLQADDNVGLASLLSEYGSKLLHMGRLDTLSTYLNTLPPEILGQNSALLNYMGDLARLHSRFQEALGWYQQAESLCREHAQADGIARALRGQARVYLDTVNPSRAQELLEQALRLSEGIDDRESKARLYELLAENKLNAGLPDEAERLSQQAQALRAEGPSDSQLMTRVLLRTGRLEEARIKLESQADVEKLSPVSTPRAHRETLLLLSIIYSFQGRADEALRTAAEGTRRGIDLQSPFITGVGHMRQGHALMLKPEISDRYQQASQQFKKALDISKSLMVLRLRVEASWGLCRSYGYQGDLTQALAAAQEGLEIAKSAGDEWIASLIRLSYGASLTLAGRYEAAAEWLERAVRGFQECSDPFGRLASQTWLNYGWFRQKDYDRLSHSLPETLRECRKYGYDFFFTRPTLLGPADERLFIPMLIYGRDQVWEKGYVESLLLAMSLPEITTHPGYQLHITTLGGFQVRRGETLINPKSWRREKSRQLFQLLLTFRSSILDRDQIIEYLWSELDPPAAQRNFKVALNTLYNVLEPEREPGSESAFILREGAAYGLRPGADILLDAEAFSAAARKGEALLERDPVRAADEFNKAVQLYQGDYLPDARYESWAAVERERLAVTFMHSADHLSELLMQQNCVQETIDICQRILACDNCWERAYRHLMLAYHQLGDRGQVARIYQRCQQALQTELEVAPARETKVLFEKLTGE